jgi:hypothetical protein
MNYTDKLLTCSGYEQAGPLCQAENTALDLPREPWVLEAECISWKEGLLGEKLLATVLS